MSTAKFRWMVFLVVLLMISNSILAVFLFSGKGHGPKGRSAGDTSMVIYKQIGLSATQIDSFKIMKDHFFKEMKPIWSEIRTLKDSLYSNMDKGLEDSTYTLLLAEIAKKSARADQTMYAHFVEMRALCTEEQKVRFDTIIPKLVTRPWRRR